MDKKLIVKQNGNHDCAAACLLSIMKYYGSYASLDEVSFVLKITNNGTNAFNVINGSRTFGFDGYGIHISYEEIVNNKVTLPLICHVLKNNMYHFIVVYKVNKKNIVVMDPSSNIYRISKDYFKNIYLNTSLVIFPIKEIKEINKINNIYNYIFDYFKPLYKSIIKIIILSLLVIILGILTNYYLLISIDKVLPKYNYYNFLIITLLFLVFYVSKNILLYFRNKLIINNKNEVYSKMNNDSIRKIFSLPYQYFKSKSTGEVESRINDIKELRNILSNILINLVFNILFIVISSILLITINFKLFLILFVEVILYLVIVLLFKNINIKHQEDLIESSSLFNKCLNDRINSYEIDKNIDMINYSIKLLDIKTNNYIHKNKLFENSINIQEVIKNNILDIGYLLMIFISIIYVKNNIISIGELFLFNTLIYYFIEPVKELSNLILEFTYIKDIYFRINDLYMIKNKVDDYNYYDLKCDIKINNLSYSFNTLDNIFSNINLKIEYGSKFLIYGKSGNGKSTLIKILLKYLDDYNGEIYFDNINLKDISNKNISYNFTYVSQYNYLVQDTIKNNIIYYRNISDKKYNEIIKLCNLEKLIDSKKERNSFIIEDNGFNISGGERQKIILARCLLKNSNYIILDEALSEVGLDEEIEIMKRIFDIYKNKTIIYISHKKEIIKYFKNKYQIERR